MPSTESVAFFGIEGDPFSAEAEAHLRSNFERVQSFLGTNAVPPTTPDPGRLDVDWLFSFKTKTIFREPTLTSVRLGALNFHTAGPEYPGSGGVNWVLYNREATSAITVHELTTSVDAGPILRVDRFDCGGAETVADLLALTYKQQLQTFLSTTAEIAASGADWLQSAHETAPDVAWAGRTYRIRDLETLKRISPEMSAEEIARRVKATSFGRYGPFIELHGYRFQFESNESDDD